ncbi:hypothetical protein FGADI_6721 [Fusarium gaditjirri]|uniref:DUF6594 domain-containing protein n=1 Tax=Fusarium gaditjirri TaxID=282569 RepID=A0A8H4WW20_9HYPO|nr:hypothetical protein FGADI_6721 [Fusarium gaditjirri]
MTLSSEALYPKSLDDLPSVYSAPQGRPISGRKFQDRLNILEKRLSKIDRQEPAPVFLSSMRMNGSPERAAIISEIEDALESYDDLLERTEKVISYDEPLDVHISSLQNWLRGNSCIAQDETSFLQMKDDLLVLAPLEDGLLYWLETAVTLAIGFFSKVSSRNPSQ